MKYNFADRINHMDSKEISQIMGTLSNPRIISLSAGSPSMDLFPVKELKECANMTYADASSSIFQYSTAEGFLPLRNWIVNKHNLENNTSFNEKNIVISNGSQQGIDLTSKTFLNKGDVILCENPTYTVALSAFKSYECNFLGIESDEHGMIISDLEKAIESVSNAKLIYIVPNFQNPTGSTWDEKRRIQLVEVATKHNLIIVEDDPYRDISFVPNVRSSITKYDSVGNVISLGSFSKSLCPGLRLGWIIANNEVIEKIALAKQITDVQTSYILQQQVYSYLTKYDFQKHLKNISEVYKDRCTFTCELVDEYLPESVRYKKPDGGLFLWLKLAADIDTLKMLPKAIERGVLYFPGELFYTDRSTKNCLRLNYSSVKKDKLEEGIVKLGEVFNE